MEKRAKKYLMILALVALMAGMTGSAWAATASQTVTVTVNSPSQLGLVIDTLAVTFNPNLLVPGTDTQTFANQVHYYTNSPTWSFNYAAVASGAAGTGWTLADNKLKHSITGATGPVNAKLAIALENVAAAGTVSNYTARTGGGAGNTGSWPTATLEYQLTYAGTEAAGTYTYTIVYTLTAP